MSDAEKEFIIGAKFYSSMEAGGKVSLRKLLWLVLGMKLLYSWASSQEGKLDVK